MHEWDPGTAAEIAQESSTKILDANGNELVDGDSVIVIKDLPVKGASKPVKAGTKVKNIKLVEGDHNISCKIDGFGSMGLKSIYVKKA
jgi:protein PhnA